MKKIILHNATEKDCWEATFVGDEEIAALFGTTTIPSSFTSSAPEEMVVAELVKRNPGYDIEVQ